MIRFPQNQATVVATPLSANCICNKAGSISQDFKCL